LSNTQLVLLGTSLLGGVAGIIGSFAVLRRRALVGDLLAHSALPGLCLAFLLLNSSSTLGRAGGESASATHPWQFTVMLAGAFIAGLIGVVAVTLISRWTRTKEDAAIGVVLGTFFGAGVVLSSWIQNLPSASSKAGLQTYIYGQAAGMTREDVWFITAVSAACLILVTLLYKEFMVFSFDPGFAQAQGWPTLTLDLTMMGALALVTVVGLPTVGVVLMAAMLILPGAAARFWTDRLGRMLVISGLVGAGSGVLGTLISAGAFEETFGFDPFRFGYNTRNLPTGPVIVLCATSLFVLSMLFAPRRGVVAKFARRAAIRRRIQHDHLLRSLYELSEPSLAPGPGNIASMATPAEVTIAQLTEDRAWSAWRAGRLVRWANAHGLAQRTHGGARLTNEGLREARRIVRAHRMWELFLISGADIAPDHVDRDADSIEHFLTPEMIAQLEAELTAQRKLPSAPDDVPHSPHALSSAEQVRADQARADSARADGDGLP
jgi:manganese/zinc/iron transport system permease protein